MTDQTKTHAQHRAEPVAEVMSGWSLVLAGQQPLATLLAAHPSVRIGSKLYAHPAPTQPAPMTDERIAHIWDTHVGEPTAGYPFTARDVVLFARAIERAHGIT